jgi:2-polyprenyl-3-methyl-5-hydroxy-6-metoxy-1,4-benzoquinol methylase
MEKEWFEEWFDSPYYHILYAKHDETEACRTVDNMLAVLGLSPGARVLDLACGKGRHSRYLAQQGYDVTGVDISANSISYARQFEEEHLAFYQHDMRHLFRANYFDAVINMFTSFGYFLKESDHLHIVQNISKGLKPGGMLLIDFFNAVWVRKNLTPTEAKTIGGVTFHMQKTIRGNHVYKNIEFEAEGKPFKFQERVRLFELADFMALFEQTGIRLVRTYGDYSMQSFHPETSKRLILVAQKIPQL